MNLIEQNYKNLELYGIKVRTNNKNPEIFGKQWGEFFGKGLNQMLGEANPTYAVYFNYESDEHGDYDFFIGKEKKLEGLEKLIIPATSYMSEKFLDKKPEEVVTKFWSEVWADKNIKSSRAYIFDFEKYDTNSIEIFLSKK